MYSDLNITHHCNLKNYIRVKLLHFLPIVKHYFISTFKYNHLFESLFDCAQIRQIKVFAKLT